MTFHPMRGCAERKNLLPSAASSAHGQLCSLRGFAAKIHFMAGASSFPQNALGFPQKLCFCGIKEEPPKKRCFSFRKSEQNKACSDAAGALGNPYFETWIRRGDPSSSPGQICSLRGFAAKIHFMAGASSFPQNALRWRFVGALGNPYFETSAVGATLCGRPHPPKLIGFPKRKKYIPSRDILF